MPKTRMTAWDILIIAIVFVISIVLALISLCGKDSGAYVEIVSRDGINERYSLSSYQKIDIVSKDIKLTVVIAEDGVYVSHSDCEDKICVSSGKITHTSQTIICAPAGVSVTIIGSDKNVDQIAG